MPLTRTVNKQKINMLLPVKNLSQSKQRLSAVLSRKQRYQLTLSLFENNLRKIRADFSEHNVLVVTPDHEVASVARRYSAQVLLEKTALGLNEAIKAGTSWSVEQGYLLQLVLAPDIAALDTEELRQFIDQHSQTPSVSICVAKDWGTNALLTSPPDAIPFRYGPHSSIRMQLSAREKGLSCQMMKLASFSLDIDTPEDLASIPEYERVALMPQLAFAF